MPKFSLIWWIPPCNAYLVELASRRGHHVVFGYHAWLHVLANCGKEASELGFYTVDAKDKRSGILDLDVPCSSGRYGS